MFCLGEWPGRDARYGDGDAQRTDLRAECYWSVVKCSICRNDRQKILSRGSTSSHVTQRPLQESADASAHRDIPIVQLTTMVATRDNLNMS